MPITKSEIELYRRYDGDLDGVGRSADKDLAVTHTANWQLLDDLRQRACNVARGVGSEAYRCEFSTLLADNVPDEEARSVFHGIVAADLRRLDE